MSKFLLDTNIVSDLIRHPQGLIAKKIAQVGPDRVATSIICAAELRFGAAKRVSAKLSLQVELVLQALEIIALDTPADLSYGELRVALEAAGTPISANDMLIAAHALALPRTLVTDNEREFSRVPGLKIENWLRPVDL
jgi:tRNA(fMet)-specific endonuclease VapC